jgi:hypothetical protein
VVRYRFVWPSVPSDFRGTVLSLLSACLLCGCGGGGGGGVGSSSGPVPIVTAAPTAPPAGTQLTPDTFGTPPPAPTGAALAAIVDQSPGLVPVVQQLVSTLDIAHAPMPTNVAAMARITSVANGSIQIEVAPLAFTPAMPPLVSSYVPNISGNPTALTVAIGTTTFIESPHHLISDLIPGQAVLVGGRMHGPILGADFVSVLPNASSSSVSRIVTGEGQRPKILRAQVVSPRAIEQGSSVVTFSDQYGIPGINYDSGRWTSTSIGCNTFTVHFQAVATLGRRESWPFALTATEDPSPLTIGEAGAIDLLATPLPPTRTNYSDGYAIAIGISSTVHERCGFITGDYDLPSYTLGTGLAVAGAVTPPLGSAPPQTVDSTSCMDIDVADFIPQKYLFTTFGVKIADLSFCPVATIFPGLVTGSLTVAGGAVVQAGPFGLDGTSRSFPYTPDAQNFSAVVGGLAIPTPIATR